MDTKRLRQRVLDLAIHGKLVPQNPQDESASELLKRIAEEKERLVKEGKIKKSKKKDNEDIEEVPFEVPQGWVWCRLEDICTIKGGKRIPVGYTFSDSITNHIYIRVSDMKRGTICLDDLHYISDEVYEKIKQYYITKDDIYMTIVGATIGKCGLIPNELDHQNLSENAARIIPHILQKEYLLHCLTANFCQEQFIGKLHHVGVQKMALSRFVTTLIPLPPLAEQHRIVSEVEKYFSLIDILEESENDLQQSIQKAKSKILDLAIKGKLVEKTGEWEEKKLGDIGKWQAGATPSRANKSYYGGNIPWLKTGDLNDGFITEIPEYITEKALEETSVKLNPEGSVLVAMYGATIGKVGILTFPATTNQACCACINCSIDKMYLFYFLLANKEYFIRLGGGGAQPNISKEKIVNTPISVPPLAEQHQIVAKIEEIFTQLDNIAEALK